MEVGAESRKPASRLAYAMLVVPDSVCKLEQRECWGTFANVLRESGAVLTS